MNENRKGLKLSLYHDGSGLTGSMQTPDFRTINIFRSKRLADKYTFVWKGSTEKNKAKLEANVRSVLEAAESALAMENAEEPQELSSEEMSKRADRILKKMDEEGISDKKLRKTVSEVGNTETMRRSC